MNNLLTISAYSRECAVTCYSVITSRLCCFAEVEDGKRREIAFLILGVSGGDLPQVKASIENGEGTAYYSFSLSTRIDTKGH